MTGNRSKKTKISSAPSFLDKSNGFYGRLEETEVEQCDGETLETTQQQGTTTGAGVLEDKSCGQNQMKKEPGVFDFNQGMMEDDGTTTLLRRKPSRWSRRSSRKSKADKSSTEKKSQKNNQSLGTDCDTTPECDPSPETQTEGLPAVQQEPEPVIVHFSIREEADDHALLRGQNCETAVKGKIKGVENQRENNGEQMKVAKRSTLKLYRKAIDRAFRRGWETFVTSLYSVSLVTVTSTPASPSSGKAEKRHGSALIDHR